MRYPKITVDLIGQDSNAFSLIGLVRIALKRGGVPREEIDEFTNEAMSGDYHHVLNTITDWVNVN